MKLCKLTLKLRLRQENEMCKSFEVYAASRDFTSTNGVIQP